MSIVGAPAAPVLCFSADIDLLHGGRCFADSSRQLALKKCRTQSRPPFLRERRGAFRYRTRIRKCAMQRPDFQRHGVLEGTMQGLMMDMPLLISGLIQYAADYHGEAEIVAREIEGDIHRYTYAEAHPRIKRMALALQRLGVKPGDRVGTLAWNTHRHFY